MKLELEVELPETQEYPQFEQQAIDTRHEVEYLLHKLDHGYNEDECVRLLNKIHHTLKCANKKHKPLRWKQELETRIANALRDIGKLNA